MIRRARRRRTSPSVTAMRPLPGLLGPRRRDGQVGVRQHGKGDVPVPGVVAADLAVVEPGLVLGCLEALFDGPPVSGYPDQFLVGRVGRGAEQVVGEFQLILGVAGQRPADQQLPGPAGRLAAVFGQGGGRFNERAATRLGNALLVDRQNVTARTQTKPVEVCDLQTTSGQLIHVKRTSVPGI